MSNNAPTPDTRPPPTTRDAWMVLILSVELYLLSQVVLPKFSIVGGLALGQLLCFLLPSILYAKWKATPVKEALRLRPVSGAIWLRVTLLALTGIGAASLIEQATHPLIARYFAGWIPMLEAIGKLLAPETTGGVVSNLLVIGLICPVCEEVLMRGAFQGTLEQRGPVRAIAFTALAFGVIHLNPFNFIGPILYGVGLGLVVWRTGSILPAILWHVLNNSVAVWLAGFGGNDFVPPWWVNGGLAILFGLLLWEFIRHTRQLAPPLSPLASTPAATRGGFFRTIKFAGAACAILLLAGASCFGRVTIGHDRFSPDYAAEDICFYTRDFLRPFIHIRTNDIIYWKDAKTHDIHYERVVKIEGEEVTLGIKLKERAPYEIQIKRSEVLGKVVWKLDPGEEVKKLMRQIKAERSKAAEGNKK
jgi:membrane protease YdiL (CAAX protease family)